MKTETSNKVLNEVPNKEYFSEHYYVEDGVLKNKISNKVMPKRFELRLNIDGTIKRKAYSSSKVIELLTGKKGKRKAKPNKYLPGVSKVQAGYKAEIRKGTVGSKKERRYYIGIFPTPEEAHEAYKESMIYVNKYYEENGEYPEELRSNRSNRTKRTRNKSSTNSTKESMKEMFKERMEYFTPCLDVLISSSVSSSISAEDTEENTVENKVENKELYFSSGNRKGQKVNVYFFKEDTVYLPEQSPIQEETHNTTQDKRFFRKGESIRSSELLNLFFPVK